MDEPRGEEPLEPDERADDDAVFDYEPPEEVEAFADTGAVEAHALGEVPSALLEAKAQLEDVLRSSAQARGAAPEEVDAQTLEEPRFEAEGNVQGVAIGFNDPEGPEQHPPTGEPGAPALTVFLAEPAPAKDVQEVLVDAMGVKAAGRDDVPINAVVTGVIDALPHRFRRRPAPCGISVGHVAVTAGTLGCLAMGRSVPRNARRLILSNNHVLANINAAKYGDSVVQPGTMDGGVSPRDQVAILERFVPISFTGPNYVDCATAWAWPDRVRPELMYLSGGSPVHFRLNATTLEPVLGMQVGKTGRTTQLRSGRITAVGASINVNMRGRTAFFTDQFAVRAASGNFSEGGDSGSVIWTWNAARNPVGLLFAGGGGTTFGNRMSRVLQALDIRLYTQAG